MKSNMEAIKEMMTLVKANTNSQNQDNGSKFNKGVKTDEEKKKIRKEK